MGFESRVEFADRIAHVELVGILDEVARLPVVTSDSKFTMTIDLGGVTLINSLGCRSWVTWINEVGSRADQISLARCSVPFVQQMNVLGGFVPKHALITSFFVPYGCGHCGNAARVLHHATPDFHVRAVPESLTCASCGERMNLEVIREGYFKFLNLRRAA